MEYGVPFWFIVLALAFICFFVTNAAVRCRYLVSNTALVHLRRSLSIARLFFITIIFESSSSSSHRLLSIFHLFLVPFIADVAICFDIRWFLHSVSMTIPSKLKGFHKLLIFLTTSIFSEVTNYKSCCRSPAGTDILLVSVSSPAFSPFQISWGSFSPFLGKAAEIPPSSTEVKKTWRFFICAP
jgi:hypothetical protein